MFGAPPTQKLGGCEMGFRMKVNWYLLYNIVRPLTSRLGAIEFLVCVGGSEWLD